MARTLNDIKSSFETSAFFAHVGFEIVSFKEGSVKLKLPIRKYLLNANNTLHGGVHATMLDLIMGMTIRSATKTRCTTVNLNVTYLSSTTEGTIFATGKILKQGYKLVSVEGELVDEEGILLAKGVGTFKIIRD
ncbi:PaaI family thioesterase [Oceanobacillus halophilus]|uniref:PaaI family thioesterase n=1 Tax=Oceanobacillus halophilus TaxID=930130 RepID=A0A495A7P1_9BACI|nr:PaaI family thioesterase [Oceanobacillus halophilus]RKQ35749.1 PaaI family thioesterase [Oceanobacillus halophilus]